VDAPTRSACHDRAEEVTLLRTEASNRRRHHRPAGARGAHSLRRVAGLSTELTDVTEVEYRQLRLERVVLVGVWTEGSIADAENSLAELAALAETAGSEVLEGLIQRRSKPDPATFIGRGKVDELRDVVIATGADTVICDGELSPGQLRKLEEKVKVKVVDRTALILDIFAQHAKSKEGKAQVELAQLQYLLPRLRGWGESLSRQAGGRVARRAAASACVVPVRPSSRPTGGGSTPDLQAAREIKAMDGPRRPSASAPQRRARGGDRRLHQRRQVEPAQPAHRRGRAGRGRAVRHPRPDHPAHRGRGRARLHALRHGRLRPAPAAPARRGVPLDAGGGRRRRPGRARGRRRAPDPEGRSARSARCSARSAPTASPSCWWSTRSTRPTRRRCCGSSAPGRTRSSSRPAPAPASTRPAVDLRVLLPYDRGDLVARIHRTGQVLDTRHTEEGTELRVRVASSSPPTSEAFRPLTRRPG
jgi:GTP-binding protein HflX